MTTRHAPLLTTLAACLAAACFPCLTHAQFGQLKPEDMNKASDFGEKKFDITNFDLREFQGGRTSSFQDRRANSDPASNNSAALQNRRFETNTFNPFSLTEGRLSIFDGKEVRTANAVGYDRTFATRASSLGTDARSLYPTDTRPGNLPIDRVARETGRVYDGPEITRRTTQTEEIRKMLEAAEKQGSDQLTIDEIRELINQR